MDVVGGNIMANDNIDFKQLRDKLIGQKALYEQRQQMNKERINKIKTMVNKVLEDYNELALSEGINLGVLNNIDYVKMETDKEYYNMVKKELANIIINLSDKLKELLK